MQTDWHKSDTAPFAERSRLQAEHDALCHYLRTAPIESAGAPEHQAKVLRHRELTDRIAFET